MGSDLFQRETTEHLSRLTPVEDVPVGVWDGFARGTGLATMKGFAKTGRAIDMLGSVPPIIGDTLSGGTEMQDRYFQEHDELYNSAVDFWTPKPNEVGVAGEVAGQLLSLLPQVVASPALAVGATQLGEGEELVRKGVDAGTAGKVAAIQATGLGLGIWMPVLGSTLAQRVLIGGAGFNTVQGVATRAASGALLSGPAAEDYKAFDPQAVTLDVLLGAAFGSLAHLSPEQRTHGAETWKRIEDWAKDIKPSELDALATLREAQHLNVDSLPGKPEDVADIGLHVDRMRTAIDQVLKDKPVEISNTPEPKIVPDPQREAEMKTNAEELVGQAERVRVEEGLQEPSLAEAALPKVNEQASSPVVHIKPTEQGNFVTAETDVGYVGARIRDGGLTVTTAHILEEANRGKGFGLGMYEELVKYAKSRGLKFFSDETVEQSAVRVYQSLKKAGYEVIENPLAKKLEGDAPGLYVPQGGHVFEVRGKRTSSESSTPQKASAPTPPPGVGESARVEDPIAAAADRFATENPDHLIRTGTDAEGNAITKTPKDFLADARDASVQARDDAKLFQIASECLLGG